MSKDDVEINASINRMYAVGGGVVQLTEGTFYIDEPIVLKSNVSLVGRGASTVIIQQTSSANAIQAIGTVGGYITNIVVDNLFLQRPTSSVLSQVMQAFYGNYINGLIIRNCKCSFYTGQFVSIALTKNVFIENNTIVNSAYSREPITVTDSEEILISGNNIVSCGGGIAVGTLTGTAIITNNKISNLSGKNTNNKSAISCDSTKVVVTNNTIKNTEWSGVLLFETNNVLLANNSIVSTGHHGIWITGDAVVTSGSNYTLISSNNIQYSSSVGIMIGCGSCNSVLDNIAINNSTNFTDNGTITTSKGNNFT